MDYTIVKLDNQGVSDVYKLSLKDGRSCYFYQKKDEMMVSTLVVLFSLERGIFEFKSHYLYLLFDKNESIVNMRDFILGLIHEYSALSILFVYWDEGEYNKAMRIGEVLGGDNITYLSYATFNSIKKNLVVSDFYDDRDFSLIDSKSDEEDEKKVDNNYANYMGFNARLVNNNFRKIVPFQLNKLRNKDGENN